MLNLKTLKWWSGKHVPQHVSSMHPTHRPKYVTLVVVYTYISAIYIYILVTQIRLYGAI